MPQEVRKRGRRAEDARKKEKKAVEDEERAKQQAFAEEIEQRRQERQEEQEQMAFYGLVNDEELEYFKQAESTLAVDAFGSPEERAGFVHSVFEEAQGRELKLMTNQICSKLIERLILLASDEQLCKFFKVFNGHFVNLAGHKYSSHCIETLLVRSAAIVEKQILDPSYLQIDAEDTFVSMEGLFMHMIDEFKPKVTEMPQHQYSSHVLRVILLILAGKNLPSTTTSNSALRSKRSKIARKMISIKDNEDFERSYQVPASFKELLWGLIGELRRGIDTTRAREMAIHKVSSPVIQLIIQFECDQINNNKHSGKKTKIPKDSLLALLFVTSSKMKETKDSSQESFVEYLLSDAVGSHFLEAIIPVLPDTFLDRLISLYMLGRIEKLARRDSGNFVVQALLKSSKRADLKKKIIDEITGSSSSGIDDNNTDTFEVLCSSNLTMTRTILNAAASLDNYKTEELISIILKKYDADTDASKLIENLLKLEGSTLGNTRGDWPTPDEMHRSLFLQTLMKSGPPRVRTGVLEGLIALPQETLFNMSKHSVFSHVLEAAMEVTIDNAVQRKRFLNALSGLFAPGMACNVYGSHIVDKCWRFTYKIKFFRERIAEDLATNEEVVKNSPYGRTVWKNWRMDKYIRRRFDWWREVKEEEDKIASEIGMPARKNNGMHERAAPSGNKKFGQGFKGNNNNSNSSNGDRFGKKRGFDNANTMELGNKRRFTKAE